MQIFTGLCFTISSTSYLLSLLTKRPQVYNKNAFKSFTIFCNLVRKFHFFSRQKNNQNKHRYMNSLTLFSNISSLQVWFLKENNYNSIYFSLVLPIFSFPTLAFPQIFKLISIHELCCCPCFKYSNIIRLRVLEGIPP